MESTADGRCVVAIMFAGCGWMHPFELGAAKFFAEVFDLDSNKELFRIGGCSAGAVVASALAFSCRCVGTEGDRIGVDIDSLFEETLELYEPCKRLPFAMCDGVKRVMQKVAGDDDRMWREASGRLAIGLTALTCKKTPSFLPLLRIPLLRLEPEVVSTFEGAKHGIEVVRASCHLPLIGGILPYRISQNGSSRSYYDGGISMTVPPVHDAEISITVDGRPLVDGIDVVPDLGFPIPATWSYLPRPPDDLREFFRHGYVRAAEHVCSDAVRISRLRHVMKPCYASVDREELLAIARSTAYRFWQDDSCSHAVLTAPRRKPWRSAPACGGS